VVPWGSNATMTYNIMSLALVAGSTRGTGLHGIQEEGLASKNLLRRSLPPMLRTTSSSEPAPTTS